MLILMLRRTNFLVQALDPAAGDQYKPGAVFFRAPAEFDLVP
jgi:hypothetical protein